MQPSPTRIAFAIAAVERSDDPNDPAIFFEDPAGTRREICARRPAP